MADFNTEITVKGSKEEFATILKVIGTFGIVKKYYLRSDVVFTGLRAANRRL